MGLESATLRPYFVHRRMVPKWILTVAFATLAAFTVTGWAWLWILPGYAAFLLIEYAYHRWLLHAPKGSRREKARALHMNHHKDPSDLDVLFLPWQAFLGTPVYWVAVWAPTQSIAAANAFLFGMVLSVMYYEYIHFLAHRPGRQLRTRWARNLRRHHLAHHYTDSHAWFGIASRSIDHVLGSAGKQRRRSPASPPRE